MQLAIHYATYKLLHARIRITSMHKLGNDHTIAVLEMHGSQTSDIRTELGSLLLKSN